MSELIVEQLAWDKMSNLLPAIVQDVDTLQVLMLGYMDPEALDKTVTDNKVTFYSRSKERLWMKGETSENYLNVVKIIPDCDQDALLILVKPEGPTCHLDKTSCFSDISAPGVGLLAKLERVINERFLNKPPDSYTTELFNAGTNRIAQKVGEEAVETALAAVCENDSDFINETADLLYHILVLLKSKELSLDDVLMTLRSRHK